MQLMILLLREKISKPLYEKDLTLGKSLINCDLKDVFRKLTDLEVNTFEWQV